MGSYSTLCSTFNTWCWAHASFNTYYTNPFLKTEFVSHVAFYSIHHYQFLSSSEKLMNLLQHYWEMSRHYQSHFIGYKMKQKDQGQKDPLIMSNQSEIPRAWVFIICELYNTTHDSSYFAVPSIIHCNLFHFHKKKPGKEHTFIFPLHYHWFFP